MPSSPLRIRLGAALIGTLALAGCGGGASSNYEGSVVTGKVLMGPRYPGDTSGGPVAGATVCAYAFLASGGPLYSIYTGTSPYTYYNSPAATCQTTGADGSFNFNLINGVYGPVLLQATLGSYQFGPSSAAVKSYTLNQLTSTALNLASNASPAPANYFIATNTTLQAVISVGGGGTVSTNITPLTTFAVARSNPINGFTVATYQSNLGNVAAQLGIGGVGNLATAIPGDPTTDPDGTYGKAMLGVEQYLANMTPNGSNTDDPYGANLLNWYGPSLGTVSGDYTAAYQAVNGGGQTFNFD